MKKLLNYIKNSKIIVIGTFLMSLIPTILIQISTGEFSIFDFIAMIVIWINMAAPLLFWKWVITTVIRAIRGKRENSAGDRSSSRRSAEKDAPRTYSYTSNPHYPASEQSSGSSKKPGLKGGLRDLLNQLPQREEKFTSDHSEASYCTDDHVFGEESRTGNSERQRQADQQRRTSKERVRSHDLRKKDRGLESAEEASAVTFPDIEPLVTPEIESFPTIETLAFTASDFTEPDLQSALTPEEDEQRRIKYKNSPLLDKHIAFAGAFKQDRAELEAMPETVGAFFDSVIGSATDFIVVGDKTDIAGTPDEIQLYRAKELYSLTGKPRSISEMDYLSRIESALRWLEI